MTYQPLYATIEDGIGERSTHSRRGRVEDIRFWLNSHFGKVMTVNAYSEGTLEKQDVEHAKERIKHWADRCNVKKVNQWRQKYTERLKFNDEQEKKEKVLIEINLKDYSKFKFSLNNVDLITHEATIEYYIHIMERIFNKQGKKFPKEKIMALLMSEMV